MRDHQLVDPQRMPAVLETAGRARDVYRPPGRLRTLRRGRRSGDGTRCGSTGIKAHPTNEGSLGLAARLPAQPFVQRFQRVRVTSRGRVAVGLLDVALPPRLPIQPPGAGELITPPQRLRVPRQRATSTSHRCQSSGRHAGGPGNRREHHHRDPPVRVVCPLVPQLGRHPLQPELPQPGTFLPLGLVGDDRRPVHRYTASSWCSDTGGGRGEAPAQSGGPEGTLQGVQGWSVPV